MEYLTGMTVLREMTTERFLEFIFPYVSVNTTYMYVISLIEYSLTITCILYKVAQNFPLHVKVTKFIFTPGNILLDMFFLHKSDKFYILISCDTFS